MNNDISTLHPSPGSPLAGQIALVAGAAGRALALKLGRTDATVYVTGRTTRGRARELSRISETIEETADLVTATRGTASPSPPTTSKKTRQRPPEL